MHRSGTSLTAAFIHKIGLDLGDNLLKYNYWNPKGYFEDIDFVEFQRTVLQTCSPSDETGFPDWGWTESEQLDLQKLNTNIEPAKQLVKSRSNHSELWGWKDPRTSLMLDFWVVLHSQEYLLSFTYSICLKFSLMKCPRCDSQYIVKNGHTHNGKQSFKCGDCARQFVRDPRHQPLEEETRKLIDKLLLEKISLAGICRATGVSESWLQYYVNKKLGAVKRQVEVK
jgi:transposase-like protein